MKAASLKILNWQATTDLPAMEVTMTPRLEEFLQTCQRRIEAVLEHELKRESPSDELQEAMHYACLGGGKRIRPVLVYGANLALGGDLSNADAAAAAVELMHSYSLVHDDLPAMDDDDLRRGKASVHKAYSEATAILVGDALQSLAFTMLSRSTPKLAAYAQLQQVQELARAVGNDGMVAGQALDFAATGVETSLDDLQTLHGLKTGALIRASVTLGALSVDNCDTERLQQLQSFADCIGLVFQVRDDILDVTSDTEQLGKPQGSDQLNGKATYVSLLGLERAQSKASELAEGALQALQELSPEADMLRDLAHYIVARNH